MHWSMAKLQHRQCKGRRRHDQAKHVRHIPTKSVALVTPCHPPTARSTQSSHPPILRAAARCYAKGGQRGLRARGAGAWGRQDERSNPGLSNPSPTHRRTAALSTHGSSQQPAASGPARWLGASRGAGYLDGSDGALEEGVEVAHVPGARVVRVVEEGAPAHVCRIQRRPHRLRPQRRPEALLQHPPLVLCVSFRKFWRKVIWMEGERLVGLELDCRLHHVILPVNHMYASITSQATPQPPRTSATCRQRTLSDACGYTGRCYTTALCHVWPTSLLPQASSLLIRHL